MTEPTPPHKRRSWRPDFVVVLLVILGLALLLFLTFEAWAPHYR